MESELVGKVEVGHPGQRGSRLSGRRRSGDTSRIQIIEVEAASNASRRPRHCHHLPPRARGLRHPKEIESIQRGSFDIRRKSKETSAGSNTYQANQEKPARELRHPKGNQSKHFANTADSYEHEQTSSSTTREHHTRASKHARRPRTRAAGNSAPCTTLQHATTSDHQH